MINLYEVFNRPTLKSIFPTPESIAIKIEELATDDYLTSFVYGGGIFKTNLQADLQVDLSNEKKPREIIYKNEYPTNLQAKLQTDLKITDITEDTIQLHQDFKILTKNLLSLQGNAKINTDKEQFIINFINDLMEKLPYYLAMFKNWNLDPLKDKKKFNQDGVSSYNGAQNTNNEINNIKSYDNFNLSTYTPEQIQAQQKLRTNAINEFVYSFGYLFNGVE